eukprot:4473538-Alexandrium_andersonii.AAC.1
MRPRACCLAPTPWEHLPSDSAAPNREQLGAAGSSIPLACRHRAPPAPAAYRAIGNLSLRTRPLPTGSTGRPAKTWPI